MMKHMLFAALLLAATCLIGSGGVSGALHARSFSALLQSKVGKEVACPDGRSECPASYTCCKLDTGSYGCCPLPMAVCCADREHCCPHSTICHPETNTCQPKLMLSIGQQQKKQLIRRVSGEQAGEQAGEQRAQLNVCPDGKSGCQSDQTCCKLNDGSWGCCPFKMAVCCSDRVHCCPKDMQCHAADNTCTYEPSNRHRLRRLMNSLFGRQIKAKPKVAAKPAASASRQQVVWCPDKRSFCATGQVCCKLAGQREKAASGSAAYGCCPFSRGVCCADGRHCCDSPLRCTKFGCVSRGLLSLFRLFEKRP